LLDAHDAHSEGGLRRFQIGGNFFVQIYFCLFRFGKIIQDQHSIIGRQFAQTFFQTFVVKIRLVFDRLGGDVYFVESNEIFVGAQRFEKNVARDRVSVGELVFNRFLADFDGHAIDGFIRQFLGKTAFSMRKKRDETKPQTLVFFAGALRVGTEPFEKSRKSFPRNFLFDSSFRQR
jgi:hypothetical protein